MFRLIQKFHSHSNLFENDLKLNFCHIYHQLLPERLPEEKSYLVELRQRRHLVLGLEKLLYLRY